MVGVLLVVHYWADLQSAHGLRCCDNIARTRINVNVSECLYSLICLVTNLLPSLTVKNIVNRSACGEFPVKSIVEPFMTNCSQCQFLRNHIAYRPRGQWHMRVMYSRCRFVRAKAQGEGSTTKTLGSLVRRKVTENLLDLSHKNALLVIFTPLKWVMPCN